MVFNQSIRTPVRTRLKWLSTGKRNLSWCTFELWKGPWVEVFLVLSTHMQPALTKLQHLVLSRLLTMMGTVYKVWLGLSPSFLSPIRDLDLPDDSFCILILNIQLASNRSNRLNLIVFDHLDQNRSLR